MRMFGAFVLALAGAIATFFSVLAALDDEPMAVLGLSERSRVAAFAAPALAAATPASLATLRPVPATIDLGDETSKPRAAPRGSKVVEGTRSAWVPPIVRRAPKTSPETAGEAASTVASTEAKPQKPAVRPPLPGLDTTTRSALGGPRPVTKAPAARRQLIQNPPAMAAPASQ